jgi:Uma2 family endonuclease
MATVIEKRSRVFGPHSAGTLMTPREFDRAEFEEGWRYELINGRLIVSPVPLENERDPNEELGRALRNYGDSLSGRGFFNGTLPEHTIKVFDDRRRADRVIWAGLGRQPKKGETPTIIVEFVSAGKRARQRDYEEKREEYLAVGVQEYWIIDRFQRTLTVYTKQGRTFQKRVVKEKQVYTTDRLPGFELPLAHLLAVADRWPEPEPEID